MKLDLVVQMVVDVLEADCETFLGSKPSNADILYHDAVLEHVSDAIHVIRKRLADRSLALMAETTSV